MKVFQLPSRPSRPRHAATAAGYGSAALLDGDLMGPGGAVRPLGGAMAASQQRLSDTLTLEEQRACAPLLPYLNLPGLRDLLVQQRGVAVEIWVDTGGGLEKITAPQLMPQLAPQQLRGMAVQLLAVGGRQLDELHPAADTQIGSGIRVHAVLEPVAVTGTAISIRVPAKQDLSFAELVEAGLCTPEIAVFLQEAMESRHNLLISGGTGTGKTTLLRALLNTVDHTQRIITIEDVAELRLSHPHHVGLETRAANSESNGEVTLQDLLQQALRMRPDRLVLGECRGAELATLLTALNTGHNGGAGTIHASSLRDVPARIEALGALAGLSSVAIAKQFVSAVHVVVQLARHENQYRLTQLGRPQLSAAGTLEIGEL